MVENLVLGFFSNVPPRICLNMSVQIWRNCCLPVTAMLVEKSLHVVAIFLRMNIHKTQ